MSLSDQLFNSLVAVNLKKAQELRPLTQSEKSLLEQSEAQSQDILPTLEKYIKDDPFKKNI